MVILSFLIFVSYTVFVLVRYGLIADYSTTFYLNKRKWLFSVVLATIAILILHPLMELRESDFKLFEFLTVTGVLFVAASPAFRQQFERTVHIAGALVSGISALLVCVLAGWWYIPASLLSIAFITRRLFWIEFVMFLTIYILLFQTKI